MDHRHHSSQRLQHLCVLIRSIIVDGRQAERDSFRCGFGVIEEVR